MSNENKIRILYVQPGKYPDTRGQRTMWRLSATIRARWTVCR